MDENNIPPDIAEARKRIEEFREIKKRHGVSDLIKISPTTLLINLFIEIASAVLLIVGLLYIFRFVSMRQAYYASGTSKFIFYGIISVSALWLLFVFNKIRRRIKLYIEVVRERKNHPDLIP